MNTDNMPNHAKLSWRETQRSFKMTAGRQRRTISRLRAKGTDIKPAEFEKRYAAGEQL